jgi:hypothetical protein
MNQLEDEKPVLERDPDEDLPDPDETPIRDRKVVTQPYDMGIESLVNQVKKNTIFLRPLSERPRFQRKYVWTDALASRLVESILLNVPIPPCYLSQNENFELDVIDGQQRIYSLYRFFENQFKLRDLKVLIELNGVRFFELPSRTQRQLATYSLRCVLITNESHPEIRFDVFERLNSNTVPLNSQELRNCIYRGPMNDLLGELSFDVEWLKVLGKKVPDKRLRDEEIILRFFAFQELGLTTYRTPLKHWLNDVAKLGRKLNSHDILRLRSVWSQALTRCVDLFPEKMTFRRPGSRAINRALFDLSMSTAAKMSGPTSENGKTVFQAKLKSLLAQDEFSDLIGRSVDHVKRTKRRFEIWDAAIRPQDLV